MKHESLPHLDQIVERRCTRYHLGLAWPENLRREGVLKEAVYPGAVHRAPLLLLSQWCPVHRFKPPLV